MVDNWMMHTMRGWLEGRLGQSMAPGRRARPQLEPPPPLEISGMKATGIEPVPVIGMPKMKSQTDMPMIGMPKMKPPLEPPPMIGMPKVPGVVAQMPDPSMAPNDEKENVAALFQRMFSG